AIVYLFFLIHVHLRYLSSALVDNCAQAQIRYALIAKGVITATAMTQMRMQMMARLTNHRTESLLCTLGPAFPTISSGSSSSSPPARIRNLLLRTALCRSLM